MLSKLASLVKWPVTLLAKLTVYARLGVAPSSSMMSEIAQHTVLTPQENILTVRNLVTLAKSALADSSSVPVNFCSDCLTKLSSIFSPPYRFSDEDILSLFPARTKMDLSLRRSRFRDVFVAYQQQHQLPALQAVMLRLVGFDYIALCNFGWARLLDHLDYGEWWPTVSMWTWNSPDTWMTVSKVINDKVKASASISFPRGWFTEMGTLLGYRNPPFPGFSVEEQARDLADSGDVHGLTRTKLDPVFVSCLSALDMEPHTTQQSSFSAYVESAVWTTSGASDVGRVYWKAGTESGKFKARKNLVPDVEDLADLATRAIRSGEQHNTTVIKSELGKIRLAVCSDLSTYLKMDWLSRFMTHAYKQWPGSTIEETIYEQTERQSVMWSGCRSGMWHLPFDFSGFDHQPSTPELQAIFYKMKSDTLPWVQRDLQPEFIRIFDDVIASMDRSWLYARDGSRTFKWPVLGGLMSGLRWTSVVGNAWNSVMTRYVEQILQSLTIPRSGYNSFIRGDDSALSFPSYAYSLLFRLCYMAINAVGADGKFAIHRGSTEFLRTWYSANGLSGYLMRTIPGLTQRKPWNPAPWTEEGVMANLYDVVCILRRRSGDGVNKLWYAMKTVWSRRKHLSQTWLSIPKPYGFGIEPWSNWKSAKRIVASPPVSIEVETNGHTARVISSDPLTREYPWRADSLKRAAQIQLSDKVSADDVPGVSSVLRSSVTYDLVLRPRLVPSPPWPPSVYLRLDRICGLASGIPATGDAHRAAALIVADQWGSFRHVAHELDYRSLWIRAEAGDRGQSGTTDYQLFVLARERLERRGMRRGEASGWLLGDLVLPPVYKLHPILSSVRLKFVVDLLAGFLTKRLVLRNLTSFLSFVCPKIESAVLSSPLSKYMYNW